MKRCQRIKDGVLYPHTEANAALSIMRVVEVDEDGNVSSVMPDSEPTPPGFPVAGAAIPSDSVDEVENLNSDLGVPDESNDT
jgi:hypothetical protein